MAYGVGSTKESYEPMFDELLNQGLPIYSVWSMDAAHHGQSYLLNEARIGDEPHWLDPCRDMLQMINHFQSETPAPIYGIGQSWGGANILMMSRYNPRLFAGIIMIEPTLETGYRLHSHGSKPLEDSQSRIVLIARRRDIWPSREDARSRFLKNPYFAAFDPRVLERFMQYNLRPAPTLEHPDAVTLTTPKAQEVYTYSRPDPPFPGYKAAPDYATRGPETISMPGFYRGEVTQILRAFRQLHPPTLYVWGTKSDIANSAYPQRIINQTGVGHEGGGGVITGQVKSKWVEGADHMIPYTMPRKAAAVIAEWLRPELEKWNENTERRRREQPPFNPGVLHPLWSERFSNL